MANLALAFDILARDKASATLNKVGDSADKTGRRLGNLGGVAKVALGGAATAGVAAFGAAMFQGAKDAVSFETLAKKSAAVIASTGNAANISVGGIQSLAGSLESLSGVDEELIINSQNVLATFTKISNVGPDKVFDDAAKAALNMSVALGTDLQGASLQIGKALNDPIKGVTALGRAGVQFTAQQKEQIKTMVASGDTLGAQKIILGELETQFGGAAKAAGSGLAGSMARLQDVASDLFRQIATVALPVLTSLAEFLVRNKTAVIAVAAVIAGSAVVAFAAWTVSLIASAAGAVTAAGGIGAYTASVWASVAATWAAAAPVLAVVAVVAALAAGIVFAYKNIDVFRDAVKAVAGFLTGTVWPAIQAGVRLLTDALVPAIQGVILWYWNFYSAVFEAVGKAAEFVADRVRAMVGFFSDLASSVGRIATSMWSPISETFKGVVNAIIRAWNALDFGIDIRVPGWVPGIGGKGFNVDDVFPDIRTLHKGGTVTPWGIEPLRADEVMAKLQVGETVIPRDGVAGGSRKVEAHFYGVDQDTSRMALDRLSWELAN